MLAEGLLTRDPVLITIFRKALSSGVLYRKTSYSSLSVPEVYFLFLLKTAVSFEVIA